MNFHTVRLPHLWILSLPFLSDKRKLNLSTSVNGVQIIIPAAMLKVMMFSTCIMWNKAWSGKDEGEKSKWKKEIDHMYPSKVCELIMTTVVCFFFNCNGVLYPYSICNVYY